LRLRSKPAYNIETDLLSIAPSRQAGACHRGGPSSWHSLPWRICAAGGGLRNSACYGVFPATTPLRLPDAPLPSEALSLPEKPRTCPQNASPRKARQAAGDPRAPSAGNATVWMRRNRYGRTDGAALAETLVRLLQIYGLAIAKLAPRRTPASGARGLNSSTATAASAVGR